MEILRYIINIVCFIALFITLEVVWANVKSHWQSKNLLGCAEYLIGGITVLLVLIALSDAVNNMFL
jgi:predicted small integral membrane protein